MQGCERRDEQGENKTSVLKQQQIVKSLVLHVISPLMNGCGLMQVKLQHQRFRNILKEQHEMASKLCLFGNTT